jgi:hypothetical protein
VTLIIRNHFLEDILKKGLTDKCFWYTIILKPFHFFHLSFFDFVIFPHHTSQADRFIYFFYHLSFHLFSTVFFLFLFAGFYRFISSPYSVLVSSHCLRLVTSSFTSSLHIMKLRLALYSAPNWLGCIVSHDGGRVSLQNVVHFLNLKMKEKSNNMHQYNDTSLLKIFRLKLN